MSISARMARGSKFKIKRGSDAAAIEVGDLTSVNTPDPETDEIDVSTLDSPGKAKEFILGATDYGELSVEGNFKPSDAGQAALYGAFQRGEEIEWEINAPLKTGETAAAKLAGKGFVSVCKPFGNAEEGSLLPFSATIRVSGEVKYTAPTAPK